MIFFSLRRSLGNLKSFLEKTSSLQVGEEMGSSELINTFISSNGPNCFSFTLMNLDKEAAQTYTKTWVKEREFLTSLNRYVYHAKARIHVMPQEVLM